jgi:hypothetical protein
MSHQRHAKLPCPITRKPACSEVTGLWAADRVRSVQEIVQQSAQFDRRVGGMRQGSRRAVAHGDNSRDACDLIGTQRDDFRAARKLLQLDGVRRAVAIHGNHSPEGVLAYAAAVGVHVTDYPHGFKLRYGLPAAVLAVQPALRDAWFITTS